MKYSTLFLVGIFLFIHGANAQRVDSFLSHDADSLLVHRTDSLLIQRTDSLLLEREQYLIKHLNLSDTQAKQLKHLHKAFIDYKRRSTTSKEKNDYDSHQQINRQQEEELKKILTAKQYQQLKSGRETAQIAALENYFKELEKEKVLMQKKSFKHK